MKPFIYLLEFGMIFDICIFMPSDIGFNCIYTNLNLFLHMMVM